MNRLAIFISAGIALAAFVLCGSGCRSVEQKSSGAISTSPPTAPPVATVEEKSAIRFTDRAEAAGLNFVPVTPAKPPRTILQVTGCGAAFLDFDGDGWQDILIVGHPRPALFRNRRNGTFENVTERMGITLSGTWMGVATGDFDNDGRTDIFLTGYGKNALLHNLGNRFADITARSGLAAKFPFDWATSAVFADLDRDGKPDLVVGHYVTFTPKTLQLCRFEGVEASCPPFYYEPQTTQVFRGRGDGTFENVTRLWGFDKGNGNNLGVVCADFDGDGRPDVYIANDGKPADLWMNRGKSKWENRGVISGTAYNGSGKEQAGMGADRGDFDHDSRLDLVVTTFQNEPRALYRNLGAGVFGFVSDEAGIGAATVNRLGFGVVFADFDGDGWLDLLFANGHVQDTIAEFQPPATYAQPLQCFRNRGDGTFSEVSGQSGEAFQRQIVGRGLAVGDYDNDGRPDALVIDLEGRPLLLHNESMRTHWLGVALAGRGGLDVTGTRVTLESPGGRQTEEVGSGRGYLSASDPRLLFGLGTHSGAVTLRIVWASGHKQTVAVSSADRYIRIQEPSTP